MNWLTLQLPCHTPHSSGRAQSSEKSVTHHTPGHRSHPSRHPVKSTHSSSFPKTRGNPLGNPLKFTHSSTFSLYLLPLRNTHPPPQSIHPLFNFPSQMEQSPKGNSPTLQLFHPADKRAESVTS